MVLFWFSFPEEIPNKGGGVPPKRFRSFTVCSSVLPRAHASGGATRCSKSCLPATSVTVVPRVGYPWCESKANIEVSNALAPNAIVRKKIAKLFIRSILSEHQSIKARALNNVQDDKKRLARGRSYRGSVTCKLLQITRQTRVMSNLAFTLRRLLLLYFCFFGNHRLPLHEDDWKHRIRIPISLFENQKQAKTWECHLDENPVYQCSESDTFSGILNYLSASAPHYLENRDMIMPTM